MLYGPRDEVVEAEPTLRLKAPAHTSCLSKQQCYSHRFQARLGYYKKVWLQSLLPIINQMKLPEVPGWLRTQNTLHV